MWRSEFLSSVAFDRRKMCIRKNSSCFSTVDFGSFWAPIFYLTNKNKDESNYFGHSTKKSIVRAVSTEILEFFAVSFAVFCIDSEIPSRNLTVSNIYQKKPFQIIRKMYLVRRCLLCVFRFNCRFIKRKNYWRKMHAINFFLTCYYHSTLSLK